MWNSFARNEHTHTHTCTTIVFCFDYTTWATTKSRSIQVTPLVMEWPSNCGFAGKLTDHSVHLRWFVRGANRDSFAENCLECAKVFDKSRVCTPRNAFAFTSPRDTDKMRINFDFFFFFDSWVQQWVISLMDTRPLFMKPIRFIPVIPQIKKNCLLIT